MNKLLREASEFDKSSKFTDYDYNTELLDGKAKTKNEYYKPAVVRKESSAEEEKKHEQVVVKSSKVVTTQSVQMSTPAIIQDNEPLGYINNVMGVPKVVIDDKYLEPY